MIALFTTPAGVSGELLLLPIQLSVRRVPSVAVTPTNLVFNVVSVRGGLRRIRREGDLNSLSGLSIAGTLAGVVVVRIIRVEDICSCGQAPKWETGRAAPGAPRL